MSHWNFRILAIFVLSNLICLLTLFDRQPKFFPQKLAKMGYFWHFCTQNVNVARFARHSEWDFFCYYQAPWTLENLSYFSESPVSVKMRIRHYFSVNASASYDVRQGFELIEDYDQRRCQTLERSAPRKPTRTSIHSSQVKSATTPRSSSVPSLHQSHGPPNGFSDKTKVNSWKHFYKMPTCSLCCSFSHVRSDICSKAHTSKSWKLCLLKRNRKSYSLVSRH